MKILFQSALVLAALLFCRAAYSQDETQAAGIRVTTVMHDDGSTTETTTDPDNHTSQAATYNAAHKLMQKIVYTLDDSQQITAGAVYAANGALQYKAAYTKDSAGRIEEERDTSKDGKLIGRFVYHYGPNGKVLKIDAYDADGNLITPNGAVPDQKQSRKRH